MHKIITCLLITCMLYACNDSKPSESRQQPVESKIIDSTVYIPVHGQPLPPPPWYRRYVGTINGRRVVLSMYNHGENGYSCTFPGEEEVNMLDNPEISGNSIFNYNAGGQWWLKFAGDSARGKWIPCNAGKVQLIEFAEDYSDGYPLQVETLYDSVGYTHGPYTTYMNVSLATIVPGTGVSKTDADLINRGIMSVMAVGKHAYSSVQQALRSETDNYFKNYKKKMREEWSEFGDEIDHENIYRLEHSVMMKNECIRNDSKLLVFCSSWFYDEGGAHPSDWRRTVNVDLQARKLWRLDEIIPDEEQLTALLTEAARMKFELGPDQQITRTQGGLIPTTDRMIITPSGLMFLEELFHLEGTGMVHPDLFLTYSEIDAYLSPAFKKRMGLK